MSQRSRSLLVVAVVLGAPAIALACMWDYDTLKQERSRFPSTLELITGKFLRHSKEFYEWRIQDRLKKLAASPSNLDYYDDLAVAYHKTGQHAKAIETILAKEKINPGLYETYSNLGTFHILAGEFEEGLPYIDKALAINPDAHFGRERYQKWLVEYAMERRRNGKLLYPLTSENDRVYPGQDSIGFHKFLIQRLAKKQLTDVDLQQAVKGIQGMMRFANHDNPLLLEALGDLLGPGWFDIDAKRLAARSYLKASYEVKDQSARDGYRRLAKQVLELQTRHPQTQDELQLAELETEFATELADADKWYAELKDKELGWIRDGKDVEAEFDRLYAEEPTALAVVTEDEGLGLASKIGIGVGVGVALLALVLGLRRVRRRGRSVG